MDRSNSNSSGDDPITEKKFKKTEEVEMEEPTTPTATPPPAVNNSKGQKEEGEEGGNNTKLSTPKTPASCVTLEDKNGKDGTMDPSSEEPKPSTPPSVEGGGTVMETTTTAVEEPKEEEEENKVELKVVYNKKPLKILMSLKKTVGDLKLLVEKETKVAPALQKVLLKGIPKDDTTLESLGVSSSTKIMVIGSALSDVMEVAKPPDKEALQAAEEKAKKEGAGNWGSLPQHKKVLDKGVPDDVMPGILNESEPLPDIPLYGMLNSKGGKVRLTFKLEQDELWIGTKERTEKVPMGSIRHVDSQPITGYEHYHILAIQLGPTEASRYFVYWVPAQYIEAIKDALGN